MRLFNVSTLEIESGFPDVDLSKPENQLWCRPGNSAERPKYSILSHVWVENEVTFRNFDKHKDQLKHANENDQSWSTSRCEGQNAPISMPSIHKITGACKKVRDASANQNPAINHIWIDTICINKDDVGETQRAINSMFRWYAEAEVCYVYLADVSWDQSPNRIEQIQASKWFLRGWTLQELLASRNVQFYDRNWNHIGSKIDLAVTISKATHIDQAHLLGGFRAASLGQKMSWLAERQTTFIEDLAYCMLGIFGVFLEPRYGQGGREFTRLQMEIVKTWDKNRPFDETLFAWSTDLVVSSGLFAPAPSCFQDCGDLVYIPEFAKTRNTRKEIDNRPRPATDGITLHDSQQLTVQVPYSHGLPQWSYLITCGILAWFTMVPRDVYEANTESRKMQLNCWKRTADGRFQAAQIPMRKCPAGTWQRVDCGRVQWSYSVKLYPSSITASVSAAILQIPDQVEFRRPAVRENMNKNVQA
jgi:hypothetical protein